VISSQGVRKIQSNFGNVQVVASSISIIPLTRSLNYLIPFHFSLANGHGTLARNQNITI